MLVYKCAYLVSMSVVTQVFDRLPRTVLDRLGQRTAYYTAVWLRDWALELWADDKAAKGYQGSMLLFR